MSSQEPGPQEQPGEIFPPEQRRGEPERRYEPPERPRSEFGVPPSPQTPPGYPPQGYPPPPQGYPPPPQGYYAAPPVAPRRRRRRWLGCLIALIIILLLCLGVSLVATLLGFGLGIGGVLRNGKTDPTRTFTVNGSPALMLSSDASSITVNTGSTDTITIQATRYASFGGNLNNVQVNYSQSGSTLNVTFHRGGGFNFLNATSVDFTITVPPTTDLQITTTGSIQVNGVSGKMALMSNAGSIGATQAALSTSSIFKTNAGSIDFTGSLGTSGTYDFETDAGSITLTLPGTTNFHLNATTSAGSITTSFPVKVNSSAAGATANGDVGTAPQATLILRTSAGSISVNKRS